MVQIELTPRHSTTTPGLSVKTLHEPEPTLQAKNVASSHIETTPPVSETTRAYNATTPLLNETTPCHIESTLGNNETTPRLSEIVS